MIHNIVMAWPDYNLDVILGLQEVKGDTMVFNFSIDGIDLTGYGIRCELYDLNMSVKLANTVAGGNDSEIKMISAPSGMSAFQIHVPYGASGTAQKYGFIEVELADLDGNRFTIFQQEILFINERIVWNNPT